MSSLFILQNIMLTHLVVGESLVDSLRTGGDKPLPTDAIPVFREN